MTDSIPEMLSKLNKLFDEEDRLKQELMKVMDAKEILMRMIEFKQKHK